MTTCRRTFVLLMTSLPVLGSSLAVFAQDVQPSADRAGDPGSRTHDETDESVEVIEARKLFLEGRALLEQRQLSEACSALEQSQKLAPAIGTLLNLGMCHSYAGHVVTAHDYYRQAEVLATLRRDVRRSAFAHNEAAALAPRRATLTLRIPGSRDAQFEVQIDAIPQPRDVWSKPMFMDAGEHRISVESEDKQTWQGSIVVVDGSKHVVEIPQFPPKAAVAAPEHGDVGAPEPSLRPMSVAATLANAPRDVQSQSGMSTTRIVALSAGGAGIAALGASLVYTIAAKRSFDDSSRYCTSGGGPDDVCKPLGVRLREDAHSEAARATVFGVAGGAVLVGAVALWFIASPSPERNSVSLGATPSAITAYWATSL